MTLYPGGAFERELKAAAVPLICLNKRNRWDLLFFKSLYESINSLQPDVLYGFLTTSNIISAAVKLGFPAIRIIWGIRASNMDLSRYSRFPQVEFFISKHLSRFADRTIFNPYAGMDHARACGFKLTPWSVIPNGIDTEVYQPDAEARQRMRRRWGVGAHERLIGLVARLDEMKDHENFLKAAALVGQQRQDVRFICVGGGASEIHRRMANLTKENGLNGRLMWTGSVTDMASVYNAFDVLCSSSAFGEGFSNVIGEAMACGIPCVATDVGDAFRIIGDTGVVVPPKDHRLLSVGILTMLKRLDRDPVRPAQEVRKRIQLNYDLVQMVSRTESLLKDLVQANASN